MHRKALVSLFVLGMVGCSDDATEGTPGVDLDTGVDSGIVDTGTPIDDSAEADSEPPIDSTAEDSTPADSTPADSTPVDGGADTKADVAADTTIPDAVAEASVDVGPEAASDVASDVATDGGSETAGDAGPSKTATVWVMRLGNGTVVVDGVSAPLFLDPITVTYSGTTGSGATGTAIAIPSTGTSALSLPISPSIASLSRSPDGKRVGFAAYKAPAGTLAILDSTTTLVKRAAAAVTSTGTVTSLELGDNANIAGGSLRGAVTVDGTAFWTGSSDKGVAYTAVAGTSVGLASANLRWPFIADGQLYVSTGSASSGSPARGVLAVGTGLPTTTATLTVKIDATATASSYGVAALDTDGTAGVDTMYVCDDRSTATGGGIQRWRRGSSGTFTLETTHTGGFGPCRGVTAWIDGANVYIVAITTETATRAMLLVDTIAGLPAITTATALATAATNATYRGVAIAPVP